MRRMGGHRHVTTRQLVLALGARFHPFQPLRQRKIDCLMVTDLEMQEGMILDAAPMATIKRIRAYEVDCPRNIAPIAFRHHQQHIIGHALADKRIELPREIRPAPFAAAGIHVEGEELVPDVFGEVASGQPVDLDTVFQRRTAFLSAPFACAKKGHRENHRGRDSHH